MVLNTPIQTMPLASVDTWGPILWKTLHIVGVHIGQHIALDDTTTSLQIKYIVDNLPRMLPCPDCQDHAQTYIDTNPFLPVGKTRNDLTVYVSTYLFEFHNAVRIKKSQPILVNTVEECRALYEHQTLSTFDDQALSTYFRLAVKYHIVRGEVYTRWTTQLRGLRSLLSIS